MTRNDIIHAAFKVWGRELYQTTSLAPLAEALGVSKPALYRHFRDKGALLDAMFDTFIDDYARFIRPGYERALQAARAEPAGAAGPDDQAAPASLILTEAIAGFYLRDVDAFVFSLVQIFGSWRLGEVAGRLRGYGIDVSLLFNGTDGINGTDPGGGAYPSRIQYMVATLTFWVARFHRDRFRRGLVEPAGEGEIREALAEVRAWAARGLGLDPGRVNSLDYAALETALGPGAGPGANPGAARLLQAAAGAVAEAGPWAASMGMVARRSGLSKSGLYAHFRNRADMLDRLFVTEFESFARAVRAAAETRIAAPSDGPEARLYLITLAVAGYLRARPDLLEILNWLRTRRPAFRGGSPRSPGAGADASPGAGPCAGADERIAAVLRFLTDIEIPAFRGPAADHAAHWILFLTVNTLMIWAKTRGGGGGGGGGAKKQDGPTQGRGGWGAAPPERG